MACFTRPRWDDAELFRAGYQLVRPSIVRRALHRTAAGQLRVAFLDRRRREVAREVGPALGPEIVELTAPADVQMRERSPAVDHHVRVSVFQLRLRLAEIVERHIGPV